MHDAALRSNGESFRFVSSEMSKNVLFFAIDRDRDDRRDKENENENVREHLLSCSNLSCLLS